MTLFIDDFSEQNNCQIIFLMAELNKLLFYSDSDDEHFMCFEAKYMINPFRLHLLNIINIIRCPFN